ncbi:MAG: hypothetical protein MUE53_04055 [Chitinophagales bacterium]|jgi:aminopeptidase N|nr:hypothetical protein [Chitinophagales bacterium]
MKWIFGFIFGILFFNTQAQTSFQSSSNPYYWKNKKPFEGYWQQDVYYKINAKLDQKQEIISGDLTLTYTNNSPYELKELFFNLYQNAFTKNSYLTNLQKAHNEKIVFGKWERENKGNEILELTIDGVPHQGQVDGSVMKVPLQKAMSPNSTIEIFIKFNTYYALGGSTRRRMKSFVHRGEKHFNGAHWYPRIAVYDRKFGWTTDQHLNHELYGDFGTYEVALDMPNDYIVEATGMLQNESEVLPKALKDSLHLSRFWSNPWEDKLHFKIKKDSSKRKIWRYKGENVHDFAWIAGPHYRIDEKQYGSFKVVAMVLEPHASGWKNACDFTAQVMNIYSQDFGPYAYPKMVVADSRDGMEYPMLTMDGGRDPSYRSLLAHEVGHNWFYAMINNNETYRAMLDEGFTQFLTAWALEKIDGKNVAFQEPTDPYLKKHFKPQTVRDRVCYLGYKLDAVQHQDPILDVHSDGFNGALGHGGGYGHVYSKTATMFYNLKYVLGDTLFQNSFKHYFRKWSFCHPYIEDMRQAFIEHSQTDLNWFFDQWIDEPKRLDYQVKKLKKLNDSGDYMLTLRRKELMQMPLDLTVIGKSGQKHGFYIPNTWFEKETQSKVLPRWIGWDNKLKTEYTAKINIGEPIKNIIIDTSYTLQDINPTDNSLKGNFTIERENYVDKPWDLNHYNLYYKPMLHYNNFDGVKLGINLNGNLMKFLSSFDATFWLNTQLLRYEVRKDNYSSRNLQDYFGLSLRASKSLDKFLPNSDGNFRLILNNGLFLFQTEFRKRFQDNFSLTLGSKTMQRYEDYSRYYLYSPSVLFDTRANNSFYLTAKLRNQIDMKTTQEINATIRTSFLSTHDYSYAELTHVLSHSLGRFDFKMRNYARLMLSSYFSQPYDVLLNAGNASLETMYDNEYTQALFALPSAWIDNAQTQFQANNINHFGQLGLRGYTNRAFAGSTNISLLNAGSGFSTNLQVHFHRAMPKILPQFGKFLSLQPYLFYDIGTLNDLNFDNLSFYRPHMFLHDAGLGVNMVFSRFRSINFMRGTTFRFDFPLFLSHPETFVNASGVLQEEQSFKFRYQFGFSKTF